MLLQRRYLIDIYYVELNYVLITSEEDERASKHLIPNIIILPN